MSSRFSSQIHTGLAKVGVFSPSNQHLFEQLLVVTGLLVLSRLGAYIPLPGLDFRLLADSFGQLGGVYQVGATQRMSLFALGIWPYILASLYMQLAIWAFPRVAALTDTAQGRGRLNLYIRVLTVLLAAYDANSIATGLESVWIGRSIQVEMSSWLFHLSTIMAMTAGVMFLVWLSDEISRRGLGDGVLLILFVQFIVTAPQAVAGGIQVFEMGIWSQEKLACLVFVMAAAFCAVVFIESARRHILVEPEEGGEDNPALERVSSLLTLRLNPAGVLPPLFASVLIALLLAPLFAFREIGDSEALQRIAASIGQGQPFHILLTAITVASVTYVLSAAAVNARKAGASLQENGGVLPEADPDESPQAYIDYAQTRLAAFNILYLTVLCLLPVALMLYFETPFSYGGASLLTAVLVCLNIKSAFEREP